MANGNRKWASSERMANIEVDNIRNRRSKNKAFELPTEEQLAYLDYLEDLCKANGLVRDREFEIARRSNRGAQGAITRIHFALRERGIKPNYKEERNG